MKRLAGALVVALGLVLVVTSCNGVLGIPEVGHLEGGVLPGTCADGQKLCDGGCVSVLDPATGCANPDCAPCAVPHASVACVQGACANVKCELPFADCDNKPDNGCEADLTTDPQHCGDCNNACDDGFVCAGNDCACTNRASCNGGTCDQGLCICNGQECSAGAACDGNGDCAF